MASQNLLIVAPAAPSFTARDTASVMFRRWRLALAIGAPLLAATLAYVLFAPNQYASRMKILVKQARAEVVITPEKTNGPLPAAVEAVTEAQLNSEWQLLISQDLLLQVVRDCGLANTDDRWLRFGAPLTQAAREERAVRKLEKTLHVAPIKKSSLIEVSYAARTPAAAHAVIKRLSELYLEKHMQVHRPAGAQDFFATQAADYEQQLRQAEAKFNQHQRNLKVVSLTQEKDLNLRRLMETRARWQAADASLSETTQKIDALQRELAAQPARVVTLHRTLPYQQSVESLSQLQVELQNKRTQLLTRYRPTDRLVREAEQQLVDTSAALDRARQQSSVEQSTDLNPLRQSVAVALDKARAEQAGLRARRDALANQLTQQEAALARLAQGTQAHDELARQVKMLGENHELYSRKRDEALIADALDQRKITNVALAEAPTFAHLPTAPNRWLALALGVFLAAFTIGGGLLGAELMRDTALTARELEALTQLAVLATIPFQADTAALPATIQPALTAATGEALLEA